MHFNYTVTAFAVSIAMLGCQQERPPESEGASTEQRTIAEPSGEVTQAAQEAVESTKTMVAQGRQEFIAAAEKTLNDIDEAVNDLNQKAAALSEEAKVKAESALAALKDKRQAVARQLEQAKDATAESWKETIRPGLKSALEDLQEAYEETKSNWPN